MDYVFDRFRVLVCAIALMGGQYVLTGRIVFVWLALAVVFCDMLRYLNALQVYKVRREMRSGWPRCWNGRGPRCRCWSQTERG